MPKPSKEQYNMELKEIQNSISWIKFDKMPLGNGQYNYALMIQMNDKSSAQSVTSLMRDANIFPKKNLEVELQNDPSRNRNNLINITFDSNEKYNSEFQQSVRTLLESKYLDQEYQTISKKAIPLIERQLSGKDLKTTEHNILKQFYSNSQDRKYIETKPFAEFLIACLKNQRPPKDLDNTHVTGLNPQRPIKA